MNELDSLKPFGCGNPEPLFTAANVVLHSASVVGKTHRRMWLSQPDGGSGSGGRLPAIQFNIDPVEPVPGRWKRIAFRLRWNRWNGKKNIQLIVEEVMPE